MSSQPVDTVISPDDLCWEFLQIFPNPDGTFTRKTNENDTLIFPNSIPQLNHSTPVLFKDITINESKSTWVRIFSPRKALEDSSSTNKLPLLVFIHGGGFVTLSAASSYFHDFCQKMALEVHAVVVSIEYRLALEHRLPAAYDDVVEAMHWIKTSKEAWLKGYVDYSTCFIIGDSAGGNIAYHIGLRVADTISVFEPLKIKGLVLHQPFFGGVRRTESEERPGTEFALPPSITDVMWALSLPIGADRDHEYCNPTVRGGSRLLDQIKLIGWRVLITGYDGDQLFDRQMELFKFMKVKGIKVEGYFCEGGYHGVDLKPPKNSALIEAIKKFMEAP